MATPTVAGDWTIVDRRRRRRPDSAVKHQYRDPNPTPLPSATPSDPSPWSPLDPFVDPDRQSKLLRRVQSTIQRLDQSRFYRRFLLRLRSPQVRDGVARALASGPEIRMVVYGVGSIESYDSPRLQLALAVLLRRDLGPAVKSLEVFDPVLSATECAVAAALGCRMVPVDERGRREVSAPTLFYMPHCEAALYDGLLEANWRPSRLRQMVVLGNSFTAYAQYVEAATGCRGSTAVESAARHVLRVRRYVREVEIEEKGDVGASLERKEEIEEDGIFKAFHDTSWHFFQLEDDTQLDM